MSNTYLFDVEVAKEYGVDAAIMIKLFQFWIQKNIANESNFYDNNYWTYNSLDAFEKKHEEHLRDILVLEEEIDEIERQLQEAHVDRLTRGECDAETGMIFTDVVSNIERVADHATNIAFSIMTDVKKPDLTD